MKKKLLKEKVIFRREYDPYMKMWKYLACFPDDPPESYGCYINGISFYLKDENDPTSWVREPYTGICYRYYSKTKIIHKNDPVVPTLVAALELMNLQEDNEGFVVVEKVIR